MSTSLTFLHTLLTCINSLGATAFLLLWGEKGDEDVTVPVSQVTQEANKREFEVISYADNMQCWIHDECPVEKAVEERFLKPWNKDYFASRTLHTVFSGDDISEESKPARSESGDWAEL